MARSNVPLRSPGIKRPDVGSMTLREYVADYFDPAKGETIVRRNELAKVLVNYQHVQDGNRWWRKLSRLVQRYYVASARAPLQEKE